MSKNVAHFVGLDYHDEEVQVCIMDSEGEVLANKKVDNDAKVIDAFVREHGGIAKAAVETCCGAACLADELQNRYHWVIRQAHAGYVNRMKQSSDKTDFADAQLLADLTRTGYLPEVWLPHEYIRELRSYVRRREQLTKQRVAEKQRIRSLLKNNRLTPPGNTWTKEWTEWILNADEVPPRILHLLEDHFDMIRIVTEKIDKIMKDLEEMTADDPVIEQLREQKGVGPVTAFMIRAEVADVTRFRSGKQLANFCGLSPKNISSGKRQATFGLIASGSPSLRKVLVEAAHRLARYNPHWKKLFDRLHKEKHKPKCVAVAAVANRWIRWLYHQLLPTANQVALAA